MFTMFMMSTRRSIVPMPSVHKVQFAEALHRVREAQRELLEYYHGDASILDEAPYTSPGSDTILASKMAMAMLGLEYGDPNNKSFTIGVIGSSFSAGHDSFGDAAWPAVLEGHLKPLWSSMGVRFSVRNQAQGGIAPCVFQFLCFPQMFGDDVDVVIRESCCWKYDDQIVGARSPIGMVQKGASAELAGMEVMLRYAWSLPRQPAVQILETNTQSGQDHHRYMSRLLKGEMRRYRAFPLNAFDTFGKPFNHFKQRFRTRLKKRQWDHGQNRWARDQKCPATQKTDVNNCPIDLEKQDGHHTSSLFVNKLLKEHPDWKLDLQRNGNLNLFVNWHPAPLGHEVMGSQVAYYHMKVMEKALLLIQQEGSHDKLAQHAKHRQLPAPVACNDKVCGPSQAQCAYGNLPKQAGPDIGDIMINDTNHSWKCKLLTKRPRCPTKVFHLARDCSYRDVKRGIWGSDQTGTLSLRFSNMTHCSILLFETTQGWFKPPNAANWKLELVIRVNGKTCRKPECQEKEGILTIDARSFVSGPCQAATVRVDLEIKPVTPNCNPQSCKPDNEWFGHPSYSPEQLCQWSRSRCTSIPRRGPIQTFVAKAISF